VYRQSIVREKRVRASCQVPTANRPPVIQARTANRHHPPSGPAQARPNLRRPSQPYQPSQPRLPIATGCTTVTDRGKVWPSAAGGSSSLRSQSAVILIAVHTPPSPGNALGNALGNTELLRRTAMQRSSLIFRCCTNPGISSAMYTPPSSLRTLSPHRHVLLTGGAQARSMI
jgi:hypothetical protein